MEYGCVKTMIGLRLGCFFHRKKSIQNFLVKDRLVEMF